jgi:hypothetical protein
MKKVMASWPFPNLPPQHPPNTQTYTYTHHLQTYWVSLDPSDPRTRDNQEVIPELCRISAAPCPLLWILPCDSFPFEGVAAL